MPAVCSLKSLLKPASFLLFIALIFSFLVGCSLTTDITLRIFPPPSGTVLLSDDFSIPSSGWRQSAGFEYFEGGYLISIDHNHTMTWTGPQSKFGLVHLDVDARLYSGVEENHFGFVCGALDQDNYYFLVISNDGYYGIGEVRDGNGRLIGMEAMLPSEAILRGESWNHLSAECLATRLSLTANGRQIGEVDGVRYLPGRAGLVVGSLGSDYSQILFDNFQIKAP